MNKRQRELQAVASEFCVGAQVERTNGGHYRITLESPAGIRKVFASSSPSDFRTARNMRAQLRNAAMEIGLMGKTTH